MSTQPDSRDGRQGKPAPKWLGWTVIIALGAAVLALMIPGGGQPTWVRFEGRKIDFEVRDMKQDPPKSFQCLAVVEPVEGRAPNRGELMAVVRKVADNSLMSIGSVARWRIDLVLAQAPNAPPFAVYTYQDPGQDPGQVPGGGLKVQWRLQNLSPDLRAQLAEK